MPNHGIEIKSQTVQMVDQVMELEERLLQILSQYFWKKRFT